MNFAKTARSVQLGRKRMMEARGLSPVKICPLHIDGILRWRPTHFLQIGAIKKLGWLLHTYDKVEVCSFDVFIINGESYLFAFFHHECTNSVHIWTMCWNFSESPWFQLNYFKHLKISIKYLLSVSRRNEQISVKLKRKTFRFLLHVLTPRG